MNPHSPPSSTSSYPSKRAKHDKSSPKSNVTEDGEGEIVATAALVGNGGGKKEAAASSFRNVSACNRCRLRKNRCDQKLPSCASCEKAGVKCVGYDPITKREIPRRFVPIPSSLPNRSFSWQRNTNAD